MAAYADGRVALDRGDFRQAVSYLTCSIDQDPGFAAAYTWRATAVAGSAPTLYHLMPDQLRRAVADYQQALALGSSDPAALNGLSAGLFVLGMRRNDAGLIQQARGFMARARQRDPSDPVIAFNLAEDQLMLGRGAARAYSGTDTLAREFPDVALDSLSSLESDLATPLGRRHGVAIAAAKQQVVAALSSSSPAANPAQHPSPPGAAGSASLSVSLQGGNIAPGQLEFSITGARGFVPQRDRLYAVWYEREGGSWEAIQGASGPVSLRRGASVLETVPGQCLAASQYLLELYVNGRLAGRAVADSRSAALRYATLDDMNFSLCHPTGWRRAAAWQPGLIEGFASPSGNAGMLVADVTPAAASPRLLDEVLKRLGSRIPAHLAPARRLPETEFAGGLCRSYVQEDSYSGGVLAAGIGRDAFDRQLVGIVYGPYAMFGAADSAPPLASDLFTSMISSAPPAAGTC
jgi:tetratricopeptide (TPR) repeat protein